jgi:cytoskeletal protein CcmA (bactofilin family)
MDTSEQSTRAWDSSALSISTIGEGLTITGNVTSKGKLQIDGHVQGDVLCASLVLGENSQFEGGVVADDVVVRGRLIGSIRAQRVTLQSTSHVEGDLVHKSLAVEQGAYFEGESRHPEDPLSPSQEIPVERAAARPQPAAEHPDSVGDKPAKGFIRSLPKSRSA